MAGWARVLVSSQRQRESASRASASIASSSACPIPGVVRTRPEADDRPRLCRDEAGVPRRGAREVVCQRENLAEWRRDRLLDERE